MGSFQRAVGRCETVRNRVWNSFRSGFAEKGVGEDGNGPIQPADLSGSHEAAMRGKLRWYHEIFLSSAVLSAGDFFVTNSKEIRGKDDYY